MLARSRPRNMGVSAGPSALASRWRAPIRLRIQSMSDLPYADTEPITSAELLPPKPKEFDNATRTAARRALLGT